MATIMRREARAMLPDLFDWAESPWGAMLPFASARTFRLEDFAEDGKQVIRAELPGLNPEKDIEVTLDGDVLTITAERREEHKEGRRSEFRYGSLSRSVRLPGHPVAADVIAKYDKGILEVTVPVAKTEPGSHHIEVKAG